MITATMPTPSEVQAARAFLRTYAQATTSDIPPREFAAAAKELGVGYKELFRTLARLYQGGTMGKPITSSPQ